MVKLVWPTASTRAVRMTTSMRLPRALSWGVQRRIPTCGGRPPPKLYNSEHGISSTITYVDHCESYEGAWVVRAQKKKKPKCTCSETQCCICDRQQRVTLPENGRDDVMTIKPSHPKIRGHCSTSPCFYVSKRNSG